MPLAPPSTALPPGTPSGGGAGAPISMQLLEVSYGATPVLHELSLEVAAGEFVALLGSSGCGKTTLLRAICGFVPVASGRIAVAGRDITHLPPNARDTAMVFQSYALWPHMTVAQNIGYGLRLRGLSRAEIERRVTAMLQKLRLDGLGARRVTALSGGQRQRVALGRALAINPRILLLDEPLSNLDARIREEVRHEIKLLQHELGITAIHVTHDREEAMVMADRIVILDAGRIAQLGTPEELYNHPASPFVASFMGAANVLRLQARHTGEALLIEAGEHNSAASLPAARLATRDAKPLSGPAPVPILAHFRSEAARLTAPDLEPADQLLLRGRILQSSYPGGVYRYAVRVGEHQFLIDDPRRFAPDEVVGIALPAGALHLYPAWAEPAPPPPPAAHAATARTAAPRGPQPGIPEPVANGPITPGKEFAR